MADQEADPSASMSIAGLISRFTKPCLFTRGIPTYRHSFSLPLKSTSGSDEDGLGEERVGHDEAVPNTKASYVEWGKILPVPSSMLNSFSDLFQGTHGETSTGHSIVPPRLTFFGEQHHQPQVMRAQLQTLHALHEQCRVASSEEHKPLYQLHLVLEHFSVLDQDMLSSFSGGKLSPQQLADRYTSESEEGFQIGRYMPLLMLARELQVPVWGGFPPRSWAKQVFREGVETVKTNERRRINDCAAQSSPHWPACSPLFTSWSSVTRMSAPHRSYLSSLMRPDQPPRFPHLPESASTAESAESRTIYPTWLLQPNLIENKGFGPAQALKDSYLAHVTAWIVRGAKQEHPEHTKTLSDLPANSLIGGKKSTRSDRPVINVVLVMCGLGHCEYGFGAPERVVDILEREPDQSAKTKPYIIASKPVDAGLWLGYEHAMNAQVDLSLEEQSAGMQEPKLARPIDDYSQEIKHWRHCPWERKMADAVLLYDWIDEEASNEDDEDKDASDADKASVQST